MHYLAFSGEIEDTSRGAYSDMRDFCLESGDVELHIDTTEKHLGLDVRKVFGETLVFLLDLSGEERVGKKTTNKLKVNSEPSIVKL